MHFFTEAAFAQFGNMHGTTFHTKRVVREHSILTCKDWSNSRAYSICCEALQCYNVEEKLEYLKTTHGFYSSAEYNL